MTQFGVKFKMFKFSVFLMLINGFMAIGCHQVEGFDDDIGTGANGASDTDADSEADTDADTAADADADTDVDTDTDSDADADSDGGCDSEGETDSDTDTGCLFSFHAVTVWANYIGEAKLDVGDIDNDGQLDIVSTSAEENTLKWFQQPQGDSDSWSTVLIEEGTWASSIQLADINSDGHLDILEVLYNEQSVVWKSNTAGDANSFETHIILAAEIFYSRAIAIDMDNDADLDVVLSGVGGVRWLENSNGMGTMWTEHIIDENSSGYNHMQVSDLDNDGLPEVIAVTEVGVIFFSRESSDSEGWNVTKLQSEYTKASPVAVSDINNDGRNDIITLFQHGVDWGAAEVGCWIFDSNTDTFLPFMTLLNVDCAYNEISTLKSADIDQDGDNDILVSSGCDDATITIIENQNPNEISFNSKALITAPEHEYLTISKIVDVDKDGDLDIVGTYGRSAQIAWWEQECL